MLVCINEKTIQFIKMQTMHWMQCRLLILITKNNNKKWQLTRTFVFSPFTLEMWNRTPSKSATLMSIDSGFCLKWDFSVSDTGYNSPPRYSYLIYGTIAGKLLCNCLRMNLVEDSPLEKKMTSLQPNANVTHWGTRPMTSLPNTFPFCDIIFMNRLFVWETWTHEESHFPLTQHHFSWAKMQKT